MAKEIKPKIIDFFYPKAIAKFLNCKGQMIRMEAESSWRSNRHFLLFTGLRRQKLELETLVGESPYLETLVGYTLLEGTKQ